MLLQPYLRVPSYVQLLVRYALPDLAQRVVPRSLRPLDGCPRQLDLRPRRLHRHLPLGLSCVCPRPMLVDNQQCQLHRRGLLQLESR